MSKRPSKAAFGKLEFDATFSVSEGVLAPRPGPHPYETNHHPKTPNKDIRIWLSVRLRLALFAGAVLMAAVLVFLAPFSGSSTPQEEPSVKIDAAKGAVVIFGERVSAKEIATMLGDRQELATNPRREQGP